MIWLVGDRGMLGRELGALLESEGLPFTGTDREVDITDRAAVRAFARRLRPPPRWIVNCAAYTAVDRAEDEPLAAFRLNAGGPRRLAEAAGRLGARLLQLSTDYVFDGTREGSYAEDDPPAPLGVYGRSKLAGERAVAQACGRHVIVRTAWLYGLHGASFVSTMLRLFGEREEVRVVADQWGSPTSARDLAGALLAFLSREPERGGVYHFTNGGCTSWYGFAREIHDRARERGLIGRDVHLVPIPAREYPARARRPRNSCLSAGKIREVLGFEARGWREALAGHLAERAGGAKEEAG